MHRFPTNLLTLTLLAAAWAPSPAEDAAVPAAEAAGATVEQRLQDVRQTLSDLAAPDAPAPPDAPAGAPTPPDLLRRIEVLLELQRTAAGDREESALRLQAATEAVERQRASGLPGEPPYALAEFDAALDLRDQYQARQQASELDITESGAARQRAVELLEEAQRARRRAQQELDQNSDPTAAGTLSRNLRLRELEEQFAAEQLELRDLEHTIANVTAEIGQKQLQFVEERIALLEPGVTFSEHELNAALESVDARRKQIEATLGQLDALWVEIERNAGIGASETADALDRLRQARNLLGKQLERNAALPGLWTRRHAVRAGSADRADMLQWLDEATESAKALSRERERSSTRLAELQSTPAPPAPVAQRAANVLIEAQQSAIASIDAARRLHERLAAELDARLDSVDLDARLGDLANAASSLWRYEIVAVEDRPITVATAVSALAVLVIGVILSRYASRLLGMRLLKRLGLEEGTAAAYQMLMFYFLVSLFLLFALRALNVPLTIFTVAGGALAIGVGFGSQNILNNFISGLILLAERPIRLGDMVDVEGTYGSVHHIGLRSTRVRSFNNVDIIVPNSTFLEKNVVNWTLSDDRIRINVNVGVMYGSDTGEVDRLIRQAVNGHARVLSEPPPIVLFADFGDDALMFEVHFWIRMRKLMDRRIVESDLRYEIDKLFRAAGIVIAYPQRDVHLDALKPLDVRLVGAPVAGTQDAVPGQ